MADPISFDPFTGWVDIENPNAIPQDARLIAAADLLRYENLGIDAAGAINTLSGEVAAVTASVTDEALAALATNPASDLHAAINPGGGWTPAMLPQSIHYLPADNEVINVPNSESPYEDLKTGTTQITYTVPPSGAVQVTLDAWLQSIGGSQIYWRVAYEHNGGSAAHTIVRENALIGWAHATLRIAGDTPGAVRTLKWQHRNGTATYGNTIALNLAAGRYLSMTLTPLG